MKILRAAALLLLLAVTAIAQVVTVELDGHAATLEGDGFAKLTDGDSWRGDVALQWPELVVMNGAVESYCGPAGLRGDLVVTLDGEVVYAEPGITIYDACGRVVYLDELAYAPSAPGRRWLDWYASGGFVPRAPDTLELLGEFDWGGPDPDPVDAGATGSGRVAWVRWPLGMAIQGRRAGRLPPTAEQWLEVQRWAGVQWDRAYHYYYAEEGYRRWEAWEDPDAIVGKGYRSAGGFWTTYSHTELHGRTALSGGKYPPDEQHVDVSGLIWTAAATGSWAAQRSAESLIEARMSFPPFCDGCNPWSVTVRQLGWVGRCLALTYALTGDDWLLRYIDRLDVLVHHARGDVDGRFWAHLAKPANSKGGYVWLSPAVNAALEAAGQAGDPNGLLYQTSGWQSAILGITVGDMIEALELQKPDGWEGRAASWRIHEITLGMLIFVNLRAPGYDNETLEWRTPRCPEVEGGESVVVSSGYAPRVMVNRQPGNNYMVGTGLVTVGFAERFARRNPGHAADALALADDWIDYLLAGGYVDGGWLKANLDRLSLSAGRRGWLVPD